MVSFYDFIFRQFRFVQTLRMGIDFFLLGMCKWFGRNVFEFQERALSFLFRLRFVVCEGFKGVVGNLINSDNKSYVRKRRYFVLIDGYYYVSCCYRYIGDGFLFRISFFWFQLVIFCFVQVFVRGFDFLYRRLGGLGFFQFRQEGG